MSARVSWISLTPVKALAFEQVEQVELREDGLRGDRRFYLVDVNNRLVNNTGKNGPLQTVHGSYDEDADVMTAFNKAAAHVKQQITHHKEKIQDHRRAPDYGGNNAS